MTIYIPPPAPPRAPVSVPQQPRQFFTPGLALGIPKARQPEWAQGAAYQRDRVETAHLIQRTFPRVTAAQPLGVPIPRVFAQQAAYQRDRTELAPLIRPLPWVTAALPLGAPIAYTFAQQAACQRDRLERAPWIQPIPLATAAQPLAAPLPYVWAQQAAYSQPRFHDRSMAIEIGATVINFTAGFALGAPPPLPFSQFAALRRDIAQPLQLWPQAPPAPPPARVPFLAAQPPARARGDDPGVLEEVLPGPFTMLRQPPVTFQGLQMFAQARGDDPAILHQVLQAFWVPPVVFAITRLEFAIAGEAMRFRLELERRIFTLPDCGRVH